MGELFQGLLSGGHKHRRRFSAVMAQGAPHGADEDDDSPDVEHLADLEDTLDMNLDQLRHRLFDGRKHHEGKHAS